MDIFHTSWCLLIASLIYIIGVSEGVETFIDARECPFLCSCVNFSVNCSHNNLFPENIPKKAQQFHLTDSMIRKVPVNVFLEQKDLKEIVFKNVKFDTIRACAFAELSHITSIIFQNVEIGELQGNAFSNIANIDELAFENCTIQTLRSFSFHNLDSVTNLRFVDTKISTVHPYSLYKINNVTTLGIVNSSFHQFLRDGFSKLTNIDNTTLTGVTINEWQCGSLSAILGSTKATISSSYFTCDCRLAWLWSNHSNSVLLNDQSNKCTGSGSSLDSVNLNAVCPQEESRMKGCPQLLPSTPHTCVEVFDMPVEPVSKVAYPTFFTRTPPPGSASTPRVLFPWICLASLSLNHL